MLRQLLTLLAILTGLAASGAPVQARVSGIEGVQMEAPRERAATCEERQLAPSFVAGDLQGFHKAQPGPCPRPTVTIVIPTVYLGGDRARE